MEFLVLVVGLMAGYLLGRWRRNVWARERMLELERAWSQKLKRGDDAFLSRIRSMERELQALKKRADPPGPGVTDDPKANPQPERREPQERVDSSTLRPIDQVMKDRPTGSVSNRPHDDLTQLRGIGPKTAELLANEGIQSFRQLAAMSPDEIRAILVEAGSGFANADPESWPAQATLASEGRWLALRALQAAKRGTRVPT